MELKSEENTYLYLKNEYGKILNEMIFVIAKTGWGKGLSTEGIAEEFHDAGYTVIVIADPKQEVEFGYAQFLPEERYHLNHLRLIGKMPQTKQVKIYHPFTFKIPKNQIPDYNFFTIPLKSLGRKEWGMIAETGWDTDTIKLLLDASKNVKNDIGLYGFLHYIQEMVQGKSSEIFGKKPDPRNFFLSATSGTIKRKIPNII